MDSSDIDVLALEAYNEPIFQKVLEEAKAIPGIFTSPKGIKLPNGKFLLNAAENSTLEGFHVLTVGHSAYYPILVEMRRLIDAALDRDALIVLDHPYADNQSTFTAGHISEEDERVLDDICREYEGKIAAEWNAYCKPSLRWGLMHLLNLNGNGFQYYDVNKKAEELSQRFNVPLVADTDVHARNSRLLSAIGTARIITDIDALTPDEVVAQLKQNIFLGNYENIRAYVSLPHFLEAFAVPVLYRILKNKFPSAPDYFQRPRA